MGVKSGGKLLYHVDNWSQDDLVTILRDRATKNRPGDAAPTIALDANWLARKLTSKKLSPDANIFELVKSFGYKGVNSIIVVDGPTRHHSKKSTIERNTSYEQKKLDTILLRRALLQQVEKSQSFTGIITERTYSSSYKRITTFDTFYPSNVLFLFCVISNTIEITHTHATSLFICPVLHSTST